MELSSQQKAAIKGSIVDPEAAQAVISKLQVDTAANVALVTAPVATDLDTAVALANANKAVVNAVIASLIAAGLMSAS